MMTRVAQDDPLRRELQVSEQANGNGVPAAGAATPAARAALHPLSATAELAFMSIVVPTYSRPDRLENCLSALGRIDYPAHRHEVIVVDDDSEEPDRTAIRALCAAAGARLVRQERAGPATARNVGASHARGEYLAFIDDDCEPEPGWLSRLATQFAAVPHAAVGGRTVNGVGGTIYAVASQLLIDYLYIHYRDEVRGEPRFLASNNLAFPTSGFLAVGQFDQAFIRAAGEDRELCERWRDAGHPLLHVSDAVVRHSPDLTFRRFWRQHFGYGRGAFSFRRARARRHADRVRVEPVGFYVNLVAWPFRQRPRSRPLRLAALLLLAQVANAAGFFLEAALHRRSVSRAAQGEPSSDAAARALRSPPL